MARNSTKRSQKFICQGTLIENPSSDYEYTSHSTHEKAGPSHVNEMVNLVECLPQWGITGKVYDKRGRQYLKYKMKHEHETDPNLAPLGCPENTVDVQVEEDMVVANGGEVFVSGGNLCLDIDLNEVMMMERNEEEPCSSMGYQN
uniref:Uncharacterized protein n=1 Tax=Tanacetum cinerariifolium TaxID=118510 RepID=A0A699H0F5_TANCI|nr:hypothetical protein [Tanacetum cinerariifolium]